jgi:hypothetical protein
LRYGAEKDGIGAFGAFVGAAGAALLREARGDGEEAGAGHLLGVGGGDGGAGALGGLEHAEVVLDDWRHHPGSRTPGLHSGVFAEYLHVASGEKELVEAAFIGWCKGERRCLCSIHTRLYQINRVQFNR